MSCGAVISFGKFYYYYSFIRLPLAFSRKYTILMRNDRKFYRFFRFSSH